MPECTLTDKAKALSEYFDENNMPNLSVLVETLDANSFVLTIACIRFGFKPEAINDFSCEAHYWLAQGLLSQSVVFGYPGVERPLESIERCIMHRPIDENIDFWKSLEVDAAPRMFNQIGKGISTNPDIGVIVIMAKR